MSNVTLDGLSKTYGTHTIVQRLDLDIEHGEFFSLLGPSGCGKTTTLRMIAGFNDPTTGRILIGEQDVTSLPPYRRDVNTVFQSYALFDHLDVQSNVAFGLKRRGVDKKDITTRVGDMLELVQLSDKARMRPSQLSGGQLQRVALARAPVNRPKVLLLDEPLSVLDLKLRRQMQVQLKQIQREVGCTFVFVTHDQDEALTMSDRLAVMNGGVIEHLGTPEEVYERPATRFVASFMGTSNLMSGAYDDEAVTLDAGPKFTVGRRDVPSGSKVSVSVRPEKIWLGDFEPGMVTLPGRLLETVYSGATTTYLINLAPGVDISALEQNTDRARREDRWRNGETVTIGWHPQHSLVLA